MKKFSWLHLTDLHFGLKGQDCLWPNMRPAFFADLENLHKLCGPWDAVFFTGDLVQLGKSEEFGAMQREVLDELWQKLRELGSGDAVLLAVPGNHDLYRPDAKADNAAVDVLLEAESFPKIEAKFWDQPTGSYRNVITEAFAAYRDWWNGCPQRAEDIVPGALPGDFSCSLQVGDKQIGIIGLNTAFLQLGAGDYKGKLVWDARQVHAVCDGAVDKWIKRHDVCLLLSHQGPDWLTEDARTHGETEIAPAGRFALHLFGHMHGNKIEYSQRGGSDKATRLLQTNSLFGMEKYGEPPTLHRNHGYCAGQIIFTAEQTSFRLWPRSASKEVDGWRFIPDHVHAVLPAEEATKAVVLKEAPTDRAKTLEIPPPFFAMERNFQAPTQPHSTLPVRKRFYGRTRELAEIAKFLHPDFRGWGVVLDGPGGMGKTALAIEAAHLAPAEHFPLKLFISAKRVRLDPDGERKVQDHRVENYFELMMQIGVALGRKDAEATPIDKIADLVRHALGTHKALLVLDNLEHFSAAERRRIYDLLDMLPSGCRAIVTSRRRDETAARILRLDKLEFSHAQELLAELSERLPQVAKLSLAEQEKLHEETGGNPLLLTWVAAQLGRVEDRCRSLDDALERMHRAQELDPNNDPLEFVFGDLAETFTAQELALLAALVHFTLPAKIEWLLPLVKKILRAAAERALEALLARSLVVESEDGWLLPPLCGRFLRARRAELVRDAGDKLAERAYALAVQHGGGSGKAPFTELEALWPQIEAALPLLLLGDNARLQRVCDGLSNFLEFSGRWNTLMELSGKAEVIAEAVGDLNSAGRRVYYLGWLHTLYGNGSAVLQAAERVAEHWKQEGDFECAYANRLMGKALHLLNDYPGAIEAYDRAYNILHTIDAEGDAVTAILNTMAVTKKAAGDLAGAEKNWLEGLRIAKKWGDRESIVCIKGNLADLALQLENWQKTEFLASEALELALVLGWQGSIALSHQCLAEAIFAQNRLDEALQHAYKAVAIHTRLGSHELAEAQAILSKCEAACAAANAAPE